MNVNGDVRTVRRWLFSLKVVKPMCEILLGERLSAAHNEKSERQLDQLIRDNRRIAIRLVME